MQDRSDKPTRFEDATDAQDDPQAIRLECRRRTEAARALSRFQKISYAGYLTSSAIVKAHRYRRAHKLPHSEAVAAIAIREDQTGSVVKSPQGFPIINPYLPVANTAMRQMNQFLTKLQLADKEARKAQRRREANGEAAGDQDE